MTKQKAVGLTVEERVALKNEYARLATTPKRMQEIYDLLRADRIRREGEAK
jgi:hypothetical protein